MDWRIVTAAIKLSTERRRTVNFHLYREGAHRVPDIVLVDTAADRNRAVHCVTGIFGHSDPDRLPVIELNSSDLQGCGRHPQTPWAILTSLDRAAERLGAFDRRARLPDYLHYEPLTLSRRLRPSSPFTRLRGVSEASESGYIELGAVSC